jgi:hypothetical protein
MIICEVCNEKNNVKHGVKFSWGLGKYACSDCDYLRPRVEMPVDGHQPVYVNGKNVSGHTRAWDRGIERRIISKEDGRTVIDRDSGRPVD